MIYTVTLNPSIDYYTSLESIKLGMLNTTSDALFLPGGKGINVSIVLNELKEKHVTTGFLGGFTGSYIASKMTHLKYVTTDFVEIKDNTRLNIKLNIHNDETEINHSGPQISKKEEQELFEKLEKLTKDDVLIISGSVPKKHDDLYLKLSNHAVLRGAHLVIDVPGEYYEQLIQFKPLLMKPNLKELETHFKIKLHTDQDIIYYGKRLIEAGVECLIVSLGNKGSILISKSGIYKADPVPVDVKSTIGAGDSMVAAFSHQYIKNKNIEKAFILAVAAASATAASPSLATKKEIDNLIDLVQIHSIK
jgi:1-phosphofructokinase